MKMLALLPLLIAALLTSESKALPKTEAISGTVQQEVENEQEIRQASQVSMKEETEEFSEAEIEPTTEANTESGTVEIELSDTLVEITMGKQTETKKETEPTTPDATTTAKPLRGKAVAMTELTVQSKQPFATIVQLRAINIRNSLTAFTKNPHGFQYADYLLVMDIGGKRRKFDFCKDEIYFDSHTLHASSFSSEGKHICHIYFESQASREIFADVRIRRDVIFLYEEKAETFTLQFETRSFTEARHTLVGKSRFQVTREIGGNLTWDSPEQVHLTFKDTLVWSNGKQFATEYATTTYQWNIGKQTFIKHDALLEYEVKKGDVLESIGMYFFANRTAWKNILLENPNVNPRNMKIGTRLRIPIE